MKKWKREGSLVWYIGLVLCWIGYGLMLDKDERLGVNRAMKSALEDK